MLDTPLTERQQALLANWLRLKHLPPPGYVHTPSRMRFVLDPASAPLLRRAWERVLERVIGITVLHGREDLVRSEETLLETTDRTGRVSTLVPISQHELAEMKHYETVWLSDGATCRMSCSCQQMDGHEHYETN